MTDSTSIQGLRDRLTGLLADWGSELASVLRELEEKRARVEELEGGAAGRGELEQLKQRVEGQNTLIEALRGEAEEASKLRAEIRNKDMEYERVSSELESKKELVRALRRDTDGNDRIKAESRSKDREIEDLKARLQRAERQAEEAAAQVATLKEAAAAKASEEQAEIDALRAELEARKTVIKSLRADQDRVATLQKSLDEKREIIEQLETSISRHSSTITELRRSVDTWKRKYQDVKGQSPASAATSAVNLPTLSDTDVRVIEQIEKASGGAPDATIAIDMRRSLLEARRTAGHGGSEK
jgi:chromosome segregation ATPase